MIKILASDGMEKSAIAALEAKGCQVDVKFYDPDALCEAVKDYDVLVFAAQPRFASRRSTQPA